MEIISSIGDFRSSTSDNGQCEFYFALRPLPYTPPLFASDFMPMCILLRAKNGTVQWVPYLMDVHISAWGHLVVCFRGDDLRPNHNFRLAADITELHVGHAAARFYGRRRLAHGESAPQPLVPFAPRG